MDTKEFTYEVISHLGNIASKGENFSKELNIISWKGRKPVYDLRAWRINKDGIKYPLKGISLEKSDVIALRDLLASLNLEV